MERLGDRGGGLQPPVAAEGRDGVVVVAARFVAPPEQAVLREVEAHAAEGGMRRAFGDERVENAFDVPLHGGVEDVEVRRGVVPLAGIGTAGVVDGDGRRVERTVIERRGRDEPVGNGHVVEIHGRDDAEALAVERLVESRAVSGRVVAGIVAVADQPLVPRAGVEERVLAREFHRGGEAGKFFGKAFRRRGGAGRKAEFEIDRGVFVVERHVAARRPGAAGDGDGQAGALHRVGAHGGDGGGRAGTGGHGDERDVGRAGPEQAPVHVQPAGVRIFAAEEKPDLHGVIGIALAGLDDEIHGAERIVRHVDFQKVEGRIGIEAQAHGEAVALRGAGLQRPGGHAPRAPCGATGAIRGATGLPREAAGAIRSAGKRVEDAAGTDGGEIFGIVEKTGGTDLVHEREHRGIDRAGSFAGQARPFVAESGRRGEGGPVGIGRRRGVRRGGGVEKRADFRPGKRRVVDAEIGKKGTGGSGGVGAADEEPVDGGAVRDRGRVQRIAQGRRAVGDAGAQDAVHEHLDPARAPREGDVVPGGVERGDVPRAVAVARVGLVGAESVAPPPEPQRAGADALFADAPRHRGGEDRAPRQGRGGKIPFALRPERDRAALARKVSGGGVREQGPAGIHAQGPRARVRTGGPFEILGDERGGIAGRNRGGRIAVERGVEEQIRGGRVCGGREKGRNGEKADHRFRHWRIVQP